MRASLPLVAALLLMTLPGDGAQAKPQPRFCTKEYAPVCALAPVRCVRAPCPAGMRRTFGNACEAKAAGARILHKGVCRKPGAFPPVVIRPDWRRCRKWTVKTLCQRRRPGGRASCRTKRRCLNWF